MIGMTSSLLSLLQIVMTDDIIFSLPIADSGDIISLGSRLALIVCIVIAVTIIGLSLALFALWSRAGMRSGAGVGFGAGFGTGNGWGISKRKKIPRPTCE